MNTLTLVLIILFALVIAYATNMDIVYKSKIFQLESELKEFETLKDLNNEIKIKSKEYKKLQEDIDKVKLKNKLSNETILTFKQIQLQKDYLQN